MIYVCLECLPIVDHFPGDGEPRECVCCGRAELCAEVDPKDLILTCQVYERAALAPPAVSLPSQSSAPPAPPIPPLNLPGLPPFPPMGYGGAK